MSFGLQCQLGAHTSLDLGPVPLLNGAVSVILVPLGGKVPPRANVALGPCMNVGPCLALGPVWGLYNW